MTLDSLLTPDDMVRGFAAFFTIWCSLAALTALGTCLWSAFEEGQS